MVRRRHEQGSRVVCSVHIALYLYSVYLYLCSCLLWRTAEQMKDSFEHTPSTDTMASSAFTAFFHWSHHLGFFSSPGGGAGGACRRANP